VAFFLMEYVDVSDSRDGLRAVAAITLQRPSSK